MGAGRLLYDKRAGDGVVTMRDLVCRLGDCRLDGGAARAQEAVGSVCARMLKEADLS